MSYCGGDNMFQILVSLAVGIIIGWNFHLFYVSLDPHNVASQPIKLSAQSSPLVPSNDDNATNLTHSLTAQTTTHESKQSVDSPFYALLKQDRFSDALALYLDADEQQLKEYQLMLKAYFYDQANRNPIKTIEEVAHYLEIEPNAQEMKLYLAQLYRDKEEFEKALNVLLELRELHAEGYTQIVENDLNTTIETYIAKLHGRKDFPALIRFLETLIDKNIANEKYMLRLAELYYELDTYQKAQTLLEEIVYDSTYGAKAQKMLNTIAIKEKEKQHYSHMIPLTKVGSQYSLELNINSVPLTLLLDTGASYTFIDEDKVTSLQIEKEIYLNTAGGEIVAHLARADSIRLQDLELSNFQLTVAPFKRNHADGLLGMNFLSQFDFKIDQDKQLLYLKKKS